MDKICWMSNLSKNNLEKPLYRIAIPGSHDSLTSEIKSSVTIGPDVREGSLRLMSWFGYYGKWFIRRWVITQNLDVTEQLNNGIRYFDLRIGENNTTLCITHQLFSGPMETSLKDIDKFLVEHSHEVVLLHFQHIYLDEKNSVKLISLIHEIFGSKLAPYAQYNTIPSLNELWSNRHQVLVFFTSPEYTPNFTAPPELWPTKIIPTYWANTTEPDHMIKYLSHTIETERPDTFHIHQGVLTPTAYTLLRHPFNTLQHYLADRATPAIVKWLTDELVRSDPSPINIVIADFVQEHNFVDSVLRFNSTN